MWREQEHLILRLYGHDDPPRIIAVTAKSKGTGKNYPAIYLDRDKIPLNRKAIEALADALPSDAGAHGQSIDALTSLQRAEREYLAQYVVQRLALEDVSRESGRETAKRMCIVRQTGDPWEKLAVEKPKLIKSPRSSPEMRLRPAMDFHHTSLEVKNMNYETKRHSNVAKFYSNLSKTELKDVPST
ncbi:hypothetical protein NGA_0160302 [Nannochloropsis gaditana CCMP526]|uniref:uncharacterized protein n=1 Tax=Nannochloropsis gaditana (strain CCMP526) TaxID=1093141 RepID=UPI00029F59E8|nr:hypothetical protein NGA_0160302 [Nannochloropsis gaditana CCMP526]XP_005855231.1 hypothetical protein NGA_0160301 [Nannochloropsis gaditana CCMP526]EKU21133.1 hypothetical protein NGA_0160301 [Nannochloropsis gaditana CCMP526]EKU21842.1 hypothetical protein NGA_0160302 [Nannochloropsis gaditana CCMP526]|eukprot:XP_005854515.1 hypothetical protein NGA_0160302 [Nannochloropsis gaditana CCMP526]